ncbi:VOC family protein [Micromonospora zhanjiangensis]|uniref:VOC family protein n=1 Tax=Micromonospora zhanjiangensis TaxID=1522057 RepID=A0ABV8KHN7_9ACTN
MDAPYPRLLVDDFAASFDFYDAVLPELAGAIRARGDGSGPYASWDVGDETRLALLARIGMDGPAGPGAGAAPTARPDAAVLVFRVRDVDAAVDLCVRHGADLVAPARDLPDWGPTTRAAHLRDPAGNLVELQSY